VVKGRIEGAMNVSGAVMSSASHEGFSVKGFSADDPRGRYSLETYHWTIEPQRFILEQTPNDWNLLQNKLSLQYQK
jgi:hypothetical protein